MTNRQKYWRWYPLFLTSALSLFLELAVIRWISGEVRLLAYFKNLPLLAAFLGLAVGFAVVDKPRDYRGAFAPLLTVFVLLGLAIGRVSSRRPLAYPGLDQDWLWWAAPVSDWIALVTFHGILLVTTLLIVLLFIPLGQAVGREMREHAPLPAYLVNILASLIGVWVFALASFLQTPPVVWFGIAAMGMAIYYRRLQRFSGWPQVSFAVVLVVLLVSNGEVVWSPYHRLDVVPLTMERVRGGEPFAAGHTLNVQQVFYQHAIDLSDDFVESMGTENPALYEMAASYDLPYKLIPPARRVLIVGAGMGNDTAAALRAGAASVDAVEIDPAIVDFGRQLHPERPYDDPRVEVIVDDARSFFERESGHYDLVVFGLLDSQTLLSSLSSVRLDSFVYTVESFEQVREHLTADGIVAVTFAHTSPWIEQRIGQTLATVFTVDQVYHHPSFTGNTFVAGEVSAQLLNESGIEAWRPNAELDEVPLATDDWPYLYLRSRGIPTPYWHAILLIAAVSLTMIARSFPEALRPDWQFFLLGAAFLLIEFKAITELALLFGTTWLVNALAISGVLVMILAANLFVLWRPHLNLRLVYGLLIGSLVGIYFLPLGSLSGLPALTRAIASTSLLTAPLFFAGLIFAEALRRAGETSNPLASNLSGTVVGGFLEYGSLQWGIKSLYPLALVLYVGALIASRRQSDSSR